MFPIFRILNWLAFTSIRYMPSYVSLQYALAFYGFIPEAVVDITSVTSRKTNAFINTFGRFTYQKIQPEYIFGYKLKKLETGNHFRLATDHSGLFILNRKIESPG